MVDVSDIRHVVQIHTNEGRGSCEECSESLGGPLASGSVAEAINHYLGHGYVLLHVGSEWGNDRDGKSISHTVALLGKP